MSEDNHVITITSQVIVLLRKYGLIVNEVKIPDDWESNLEEQEDYVIVQEALIEFIPGRHVFFGDMCAPGIWEVGSLVNEYSHVINDFVEASEGKIEIENFNAENPIGEIGEEDTNRGMVIEFDHNSKHYKWEFAMDDSDESFNYYIDLANLVSDVMQGDVLFMGEEAVSAFFIPKALIAELESFGIDPSANLLAPHIQSSGPNSQTDSAGEKSILNRIYNKFFN